ncbi:PREDICTED: protein SPT2 homolog isoform X1 [Lupinus angustifolius]|uniref:protein SPT2 homolog isoform X1 n=1 Tax=Lupinus angustifolius TaxID=3871 RepID=UPI00092FD32C|nr:PREDICTED: protein SPT2 homolog isoform X1 [Lupinus angustifolius]XP_019445321.1 PREDICTED: protein SPT2 homolog isoform X1 [Lupinus angustifolius]XP_019445322.1 PREDICTED: protein SPT2 homolog isoform X1 [Lupinus angustifolius]
MAMRGYDREEPEDYGDHDDYEGEEYEEYEGEEEEGYKEEEPRKPTKEELEYLVLRQRLKESIRKQTKKESSSSLADSSGRKKKLPYDNYGSFFGPSQPVIAQRVIQESKSLLENQHQASRPANSTHTNKNTNRVPNGGLKSSSHSQAPPKVSEKIIKAQKIKGTRDYSFLLSDDAPVPKKEAPPQNISMRNSEGRPAQVTAKSQQPMMNGGKLVRGSGDDRKPVSGASHLHPQSGSNYKLTSASKASNASADCRKQLSSSSGNGPALSRKQLGSNSGNEPAGSRRHLGSNSGSGPGRPVEPKGLPSKKPVSTMMNKSSTPGIRSLVNGGHRPSPSKVHSSFPKQNVEQRKDLREQNKPKLVPRQPLAPSKAQVNKPPLKQNQMHSKSQDHHPRNKVVKRRADDDVEDGVDIRSMIRSMFNYNPNKFANDDDDDNMEAGFDEILREERRSAKIAKKEDEEQLRLIEEEEEREQRRRMAKKRKLG